MSQFSQFPQTPDAIALREVFGLPRLKHSPMVSEPPEIRFELADRLGHCARVVG